MWQLTDAEVALGPNVHTVIVSAIDISRQPRVPLDELVLRDAKLGSDRSTVITALDLVPLLAAADCVLANGVGSVGIAGGLDGRVGGSNSCIY